MAVPFFVGLAAEASGKIYFAFHRAGADIHGHFHLPVLVRQ